MPPYLNDDEGIRDDDIGLLGKEIGPTASGEAGAWVGVPLVGLSVEAEAIDFIAEVKLTQCYQNTGSLPIEAKYVFPVDESAAVCGFQAEYEDGRIVKGAVKEKNEAKRSFNRAVAQGKQANLLEVIRRDVFSLSLGNLPPRSYVKVTITYVTALKARDHAAAFILPMVVAPRYTPCYEKLSQEETQAMDTSLDASSSSAAQLFGVCIKVHFSCLSNIKAITSPSHKTEPGLSTWLEGKTGHLMLQAPLDRDLVVLVVEEQCHQPRVVVERSPSGSLAGFVSLFPKLEFVDTTREFIFLIDRSGSMGGNKMKQARESLLLFLRALPVSCTFNIVGFGSTFSALFPYSTPYNDETLQMASRYAMDMEADMGGTEILGPLKHIFGQQNHPNLNRQVFVLTDGQVSNDLQVFDVVRRYCSNDAKSRLFSVGLGNGVSCHLVEGMACAGGGTARFVEDGDPVQLQEKLLGQLKQALQPSLNNISIKWGFPKEEKEATGNILRGSDEGVPVKTLLGYRSPSLDSNTTLSTPLTGQPKIIPTNIPPVFNKERFLSYAIFPEGGEIPKTVTVRCATKEGLLETTLEIGEGEVFQGTIAHRMAARAGISEYEDHRKTRSAYSSPWSQCTQSATGQMLSEEEALQLALDNSLASEQTAFVAIMNENAISGTPSRALAAEEGEKYIRADGKKVRRVKREPTSQQQDTVTKDGFSKDEVEDLKEAFTMFDANGDGTIGLNELQQVMRKLGQNPSEAELIEMTSTIEGENDLNFDEFLILMQSRARVWDPEKELRDAFQVFDTDNNGSINRKDLKRLMKKLGQALSAAELDAMMDELDTNGDGEIAFEEFKDVMGVDCEPNRDVPSPSTSLETPRQPPAPTASDRLLQLCILQKTNGSFAWDESFMEALSFVMIEKDMAVVTAAAPMHSDGYIRATALAVVVMRIRFPTLKSVWELQEQKALQFLLSPSCGLSTKEVNSLLRVIEADLSSY